MNSLERVRLRPVRNLEYGISSLHCWIRVFEAILRISYRLPFKKWTARTPEQKKIKEETKAQVQQRVFTTMSLRVDQPRPGGSGDSNDGNTARTAFQQPELFSAATGVDVELIRRLHVILQAVSCCLPLCGEKLSAFCSETAELYVRLYSWYPMTPTLHRLLMHSAALVEQCLLPIGMMSEEASEARHKDVRLYRLQRARRDSRLNTMADVFGRLLVTSDPVISSSGASARRNARSHSRRPLLAETQALLAEPMMQQPTASDVIADSDSD
ncbi:hypothetical protein FJT64_015854 [Amphibalanus amphitrite]|uniref:Uncharacterized protein n=1 Tax=Amphibalanus amphitrite TaxID=1232801 RepID=A0A6A4XBE5_AMPAM|nr:hypothetical protein FJT64_015854 [Amphibalanus amphitrite]